MLKVCLLTLNVAADVSFSVGMSHVSYATRYDGSVYTALSPVAHVRIPADADFS